MFDEYFSPCVHDVYGNDPVLDQYDVAGRDELVGGMFDDYVTGTLYNVNAYPGMPTVFTPGVSGRAFSTYNADNEGHPTSISLSENLQPWYEFAGNCRFQQLIDTSNRYYDSLMPAINTCFSDDGSTMFVDVLASSLGNSQKFDDISPARIFFSWRTDTFGSVNSQVVDRRWSFAFPFETQYSDAQRLLDISKSFVVRVTSDFISNTLSSIPPKQFPGFMIGFGTQMVIGNAHVPAATWVSDVNLSATNVHGFYTTGSASAADLAKCLYGYGDNNTIFNYQGSYVGGNNFPFFRNTESVGNSQVYAFGPMIRGWKYGVHNGIPEFFKSYVSRTHHGFLRDVFEQRIDTKYYFDPDLAVFPAFSPAVSLPVVSVLFLDADGNNTDPAHTWSQNLSYACTSSFPFFDNETRDRPDINPSMLNTSLVTVNADMFVNQDV